MAPEPVAGGDPAVFVEIEVDEGEVDLASGLAWAAGATGIEERDRPGGRVELAVGVGTAGPEELVAVLGARWSARVAVIEAERWDGLLDAWRAWARPWRVGHLVVEPPWQPADPSTVGPDDVVLAIDPGRAFGSGAHPSTRLALGLLADVLTHPKSRTWPASASGGRGDGPGSGSGGADDQAASGLGALEAGALEAGALGAGALEAGALEADVTVVDVGCGSGVLAVAAARLGAGAVIAVDIDPVAVAATDENARRNGVADRVRAGLDPVATLHPAAEPAGAVGRVVVVANLLLPVQRELAADLDRLAGDGPLVLAGLLDAQRESALAAHPGHAVVDERHEDGWCGLVLRRAAGGRGAT